VHITKKQIEAIAALVTRLGPRCRKVTIEGEKVVIETGYGYYYGTPTYGGVLRGDLSATTNPGRITVDTDGSTIGE
jgi:hypothetical protein